MYITNNPEIATIAEKSGVNRIFVDMEFIGKDIRQKGMDSVKNHHTINDVRTIRGALQKSQLLVRVNPIHDAQNGYDSSENEINSVIEEGADVVMLPYFKTKEEVLRFLSIVNGRAITMLLLETPEAASIANELVAIPGIDEIHIGLNDLSLGYKKTFMFELLSDGTVEQLCNVFKTANIPFGFGGVSSIGTGDLPAENIIMEHYRLGSSMVILSRSFCNTSVITDINLIKERFEIGVNKIRLLEKELLNNCLDFESNRQYVASCVERIVKTINTKKNQ